MDHKMGPVELFAAAFALSSVGGLTALLRSKQKLSTRSVIAAVLYSGLMSLIIALLSYQYLGVTNPYFLLGVCGLAGIGGTTLLDFLVQFLKNGGVDVDIRVKPKADPGDSIQLEDDEDE